MLVRKLSLAVNLAIAVMVAAAWIGMMFALDPNQTLAARGLWSRKYFTVLSNLFEGAASVIWLVSSRSNGKASALAELLKFI